MLSVLWTCVLLCSRIYESSSILLAWPNMHLVNSLLTYNKSLFILFLSCSVPHFPHLLLKPFCSFPQLTPVKNLPSACFLLWDLQLGCLPSFNHLSSSGWSATLCLSSSFLPIRQWPEDSNLHCVFYLQLARVCSFLISHLPGLYAENH